MAMQMMKRSMSRMLKQSIVDLCRSSIGAEGYVEIDGIVCITIGEEETEEIVVKVHEILGDDEDLPVNIRRNNPMPPRNAPPANQQGGRMQQQHQQQQRQSQSMQMSNSQHGGKAMYSQSPGKHTQAHISASTFTQAGHTRPHPSTDGPGFKRSNQTPTKNQPDAKKPPPPQAPPSQLMDEGIIKIEIESDDDEGEPPASGTGKASAQNVVCNVCEQSLPSLAALQTHMTDVHQASVCGICYQLFRTKSDYERHMKTHNKRQDLPSPSPSSDGKTEKKGDERFKCGVCGNTSDLRQTMVEHLKSGHEFQGCYTCMLCREYFPNKPTFTIHRKLSHPQATDSMCINCGVGLKHIEVDCHKKECVGDKPTPSVNTRKMKKGKDADSEQPPAKRKCANPSNTGKAANKPANTDKSNKFECQICCLLLDNFAAYGNHIKSVHQRFVCPICAGTFQSNRAVQQHTTRHTNNLSFPCTKCGIGSHTEDQFKRHNIVAHNVRPGIFTCAQCDIMLGSKEEFQGHMNDVHKVEYLGEEEMEKYVVLEEDEDMYNEEEEEYMDEEGYGQNHGEYDNGQGYRGHDEHYDIDEEEGYDEEDDGDMVTCNICELMMPSVNALKEHIHTVHHAVVCEQCWRPFLSQTELDSHMKVHLADSGPGPGPGPQKVAQKPKSPKVPDTPKNTTPATPVAGSPSQSRNPSIKSGLSFKCGVCGSGSDGRSGMVEHLQNAHEYLGCYTCLLCGEFFPNKPTFTIHRKLSHSNANEMICDTCGVGLMDHEFDQHIEECKNGGVSIKDVQWDDKPKKDKK